ncbi:MAG: type II toxin-antitoxin system VapC family toxin [Luteolibacter sp.]
MVMRYLFDTNFISELKKNEQANRGVQDWVLRNDSSLCALSVVTLAEIRKGIEIKRRTDTRQAFAIEQWLEGVLVDFAESILPVTVQIADRWGRLMAATRLPGTDMLLAATALEHGLTVITRNVKDFEGSGVSLHNPWK